jgi:hypothetical protein
VRREELAHVLRAAARVAGDPDILVLGSQAILGTFGEDDLPEIAWLSVEADLAFFDDDDSAKANLVDGAIGELSSFHQTFAYYAQGVDVSTAILPVGWRERLVRFDARAAEPATALCLERHDLIVAKLAAHREKDFAFAYALLEARLADLGTLLDRAALLPAGHGVARARVIDWLRGSGHRLGLTPDAPGSE